MKYHYHIKNEKFHIGESVDEWAFSLVIDIFPNLQAWKEAFRVPGAIIKDSNHKIISPDDMEMIITLREHQGRLENRFGERAFFGQHGLLCIKVGSVLGGYRCVANEGCWDLVTRK